MQLNFVNRFLDSGALVSAPNGKIYVYCGLSAASIVDPINFDLFAPTFFAGPGWQLAYKADLVLEFDKLELLKLFESTLVKNQQVRQWSPLSFNSYEESFLKIQRMFQTQILEKAVPTISSYSKKGLERDEKLQILVNLLRAPTNSFIYGFWQESEPNETYGYLGLTPESLFYIDNDFGGRSILQTMSLAGTQARGNAVSLLEQERLLREQSLVSDQITLNLKEWGELEVHGPYVYQLPHIEHLRTDFKLVGRVPFDPLSMTKILHPTPALGVFPQSYGIEWMRELPEQKTRKNFGAPTVFRLSKTQILAVVNIRNIQWDAANSWIETGGGLLRGSSLNQEFEELNLKQNAVRSFLFERNNE